MTKRGTIRTTLYLCAWILWGSGYYVAIWNEFFTPQGIPGIVYSFVNILGSIAMCYCAYQYRFYDVLIFFALFYLGVGVLFFLYKVTGEVLWIFGFLLYPVVFGFDFNPDEIKTILDIVRVVIACVSCIGIPILCVLLLFRLRRDKKQQVEQ